MMQMIATAILKPNASAKDLGHKILSDSRIEYQDKEIIIALVNRAQFS